MKTKLLNLSLFALLAFSVTAQEWTAITADSHSGLQSVLLSENENEIVVKTTLDGFSKTKVATSEGDAYVISAPSMVSMLEEGCPDLPMGSVPVIIGDDAKMDVEVVRSKYIDIKDILIAPSKGNLSRSINPDDVPYTFGKVYQMDGVYPQQAASLSEPYILRDFRGQNIMVKPFAYNPTTKTLRVFYEMEIAIRRTGTDSRNVMERKTKDIVTSVEFMQLYERRFINFGQRSTSYSFIVDQGKMLVVSYPSFVSAMQPFVDWKNASGRPTEIVSLSETGTGENDILSYISTYYDSNPTLTYILLVGDLAQVTSYYDYSAGGRTDSWYGRLLGNDDYNELIVGRFSCENTTHVQTQVNKVINYERDLDATATWLTTGIGIAANEGNGSGHNGGEADYVHMDYIRDTLLNYTYTTVYQDYSGVGSGTTASQITSQINAGASIINFCNHGSETSWSVANYSNSHVNALVNSNKLPFIWSTACLNGKFDVTCFAEAWMRATNNQTGEPTGAIGTMMSWISQPWTPPMTGQDEMVNVLTEHVSTQYHHTFGGASINGCMKILDLHPSDNGSTAKTWILFGDPSLMCRTATPEQLVVSHQPAVMLGATSMDLTVANADGAIATLSANNQVLGSAVVQNGFATISFEPIDFIGSADLVVIGYNKVTYQATIQTAPSDNAYVTVVSQEINDSDGNNNSQLDNGETAVVDFTLKNIGSLSANNVQVRFSCDDPYISCDTVTIHNVCSSIADGAEVTASGILSVTAAQYVPNKHTALVKAIVSDDESSWSSTMLLTVCAPEFEIMENVTVLSESGMNKLVPSEVCSLTVPVENKGDYLAEDVKVWLESDDDIIGLANAPVRYDVVDVETVNANMYLTVSPNAPVSTSVGIWVKVAGGYNDMYRDSIYMTFNVGSVEDINMQAGIFQVEAANFYDSGGPDEKYSSGENHTIVFRPISPDHVIKVTFQSFKTETNYDILKVYNSHVPVDSALVRTMTGNLSTTSNLMSPIVADNAEGALTFKFTSDSYLSYDGWVAFIESVYVGDPYIEAKPIKTLCQESTSMLDVRAYGFEPSTYEWTPAELLDNANIQQPTATVSEPTWFYVTVDSIYTDSVFVNHFDTFQDIESKLDNGVLKMCYNYSMSETLDATIADSSIVSYMWLPTEWDTPVVTINTSDFQFEEETVVEFAAIARNIYGCEYVKNFSVLFAECGADVDENDGQYVEVYPNPALSQFHITSDVVCDDFAYTIYNIQGQVVDVRNVGSFSGNAAVNVENLSAGIYFVQIQLAGKLYAEKIVVGK